MKNIKDFNEFVNEGNLIAGAIMGKENWKEWKELLNSKEVQEYIKELKKEGKTKEEINDCLIKKFPKMKEIQDRANKRIEDKFKKK